MVTCSFKRLDSLIDLFLFYNTLSRILTLNYKQKILETHTLNLYSEFYKEFKFKLNGEIKSKN